MKKIKAILIGAGNRGTECLASYAINNPQELEFVAVAEPNKIRRDLFARVHNIPHDMCFSSWEPLLEKKIEADTVLICTQDNLHYLPAVSALQCNYNVLLEKPMSTSPEECVSLINIAEKSTGSLAICHVLRYTPFFTKLKQLLDSGTIGDLVSIAHNENVGYYHYAHSYVRGNWGNRKKSSPMILAKSCHDMDLLLWLVGSDCQYLSSFGSLSHFKAQNAPPNSPKHCLDGCDSKVACPYYAPKHYLTSIVDWPSTTISEDSSLEARTKALQKGPYGRCVYHCDNDVVDHQVVNMEFKNKVTATFTMCAFTNEVSRTIKIMGTKGEIRGAIDKNELEITTFLDGTKQIICLITDDSGHNGGDFGLMRSYVAQLQTQNKEGFLTSGKVSLQSHLMSFAAEKSRLESTVIDLGNYLLELA